MTTLNNNIKYALSLLTFYTVFKYSFKICYRMIARWYAAPCELQGSNSLQFIRSVRLLTDLYRL